MSDGLVKFVQWLFVKTLIAGKAAKQDELLNQMLALEEQLLPDETPGDELESLYQAYEQWEFGELSSWLDWQSHLESELRGMFPEFDRFLISSKARQN